MSWGLRRTHRVLPGFGLSLGFTLGYLTLIVLVPLSAVFVKTSGMTLTQFFDAVASPRVVASYKLTFGLSFIAACINAVFGLLLAWGLVRYPFPGRKLIDALIDLMLHEASPAEIVAMLADGRADIGIATEALQDVAELAAFPYYAWHHGVIVPKDHPLIEDKLPTLEKIAEWPIVTYQKGYTGRARIDAAFEVAELIPDIVMSALDADVIKAYVELELGIGIIASMAFNPERDPHLRLLDARHLFAGNTSRIAVRRGSYLRGYAYRFIALCSPKLDEAAIRSGAAALAQSDDE